MGALSKRRAPALLVVGALTMLTVLAAPAGARIASTNAKFCAVLSSDQGQGINFEGLGPDEATYSAKLMRKAAKTGVPAKLKVDLRTLAKIYDRIADGEPAARVLTAKRQKAILPALTRFSKYVGANCSTAPPT